GVRFPRAPTPWCGGPLIGVGTTRQPNAPGPRGLGRRGAAPGPPCPRVRHARPLSRHLPATRRGRAGTRSGVPGPGGSAPRVGLRLPPYHPHGTDTPPDQRRTPGHDEAHRRAGEYLTRPCCQPPPGPPPYPRRQAKPRVEPRGGAPAAAVIDAVRPPPMICAAAGAPPADSSTGRRSSTHYDVLVGVIERRERRQRLAGLG